MKERIIDLIVCVVMSIISIITLVVAFFTFKEGYEHFWTFLIAHYVFIALAISAGKQAIRDDEPDDKHSEHIMD